MNSFSLPRLSLVLFASLFVLAGCGGDDEPAAAAPTTTTTTTVAVETTVEEAPTISIAEAPDTGPDTRTEQEIAVDNLDVMMVQLGIVELEDLEGTTECVIERLESENVEFTGEGTAELIALSACNETVIAQWLPTTNPALPNETWACTVESIGDWISELSIPDAEAFLNAITPPDEFIEQTADRCNASVDDISGAFFRS